MEFTNQYLNFKEYQELGGTLEELLFNLLEFKAQNEIDKYTFGRLKGLKSQTQDTKVCIYDLISIFQKYESISQTQAKGKSSENIDGYSVSYLTPNTDTTKTQEQEISDCIRSYLIDCKLDDGTPYMYCGVS